MTVKISCSYKRREMSYYSITRILAPTDLSQTSLNALHTAVHIRTVWADVSDDVLNYARQNLIHLIVVTNVLDVTAKPGFLEPYIQTIVNSAKIPVLNIKTLRINSYV